jgi:hypothetical protein
MEPLTQLNPASIKLSCRAYKLVEKRVLVAPLFSYFPKKKYRAFIRKCSLKARNAPFFPPSLSRLLECFENKQQHFPENRPEDETRYEDDSHGGDLGLKIYKTPLLCCPLVQKAHYVYEGGEITTIWSLVHHYNI